MSLPISQRYVRFVEVLLTIIWYLQIVSIIVFSIVLIIGAVVKGDIMNKFPLTLEMPMEFEHDQKGSMELTDGTKLPILVQVSKAKVRLPFHQGNFMFFSIIGGLCLGLVFMLSALYLLRKIVASVKAEQPFTRENWSRVRLLGILIAGKAFFGGIMEFIIRHYYGAQFHLEDAKVILPDFNLDWEWLTMGLLVILLAEIFKAGAVLQEERELTI